MRVSIKGLLRKPGILFFPFTLFLLFAGIFAVGQSSDDESQDTETLSSESEEEDGESIGIGEEKIPWMPPGPPRWFRSNAGGMALEEIPSRLAAIRNEYALVIDYVDPSEIDPFPASFYRDTYTVEIRVLYKNREESRKQWLFKDESGNTMVNAVFTVSVPEAEAAAETETEESESAELDITTLADTDTADDSPSPQSPVPSPLPKGPVTIGFIEVYNDDLQISEDYRFTDGGEEIVTAYFYNENMLIRTETRQREQSAEADYQKMYTDNYRYNRSYFLRNIERVFHGQVEIEPVVLLFPGRVMEMALDKDFIKEKVVPDIDFIKGSLVGENYRIVYDTDERGRILSQTMYNQKGEEVWEIKNTWVGDRIVSVLKTEGDDKKLTEFEYNSDGDRIVQRDIHNGVLERQVITNGDKETEELFMNGVMVLRAYWENGRKISEERVRRR